MSVLAQLHCNYPGAVHESMAHEKSQAACFFASSGFSLHVAGAKEVVVDDDN